MSPTLRSALAAVTLSLLSACAGNQQQANYEVERARTATVPASQKEAEETVRAAILNELVDPDSAMFTFEPYYRGAVRIYGERYQGIFVCGKVNTKNRMGGYTGMQQFIANLHPADPKMVVKVVIDEGRMPLVAASQACDALFGGTI